jgi:hypothetical protein
MYMHARIYTQHKQQKNRQSSLYLGVSTHARTHVAEGEDQVPPSRVQGHPVLPPLKQGGQAVLVYFFGGGKGGGGERDGVCVGGGGVQHKVLHTRSSPSIYDTFSLHSPTKPPLFNPHPSHIPTHTSHHPTHYSPGWLPRPRRLAHQSGGRREASPRPQTGPLLCCIMVCVCVCVFPKRESMFL